MGLMSRLSFSGKSFLNTAEYLDPVTDEWTTFIPVDAIDFPEKPDADGYADVKVDADQEVEVSAATSNDVLSSASPLGGDNQSRPGGAGGSACLLAFYYY